MGVIIGEYLASIGEFGKRVGGMAPTVAMVEMGEQLAVLRSEIDGALARASG